jgi:hypothetical protein
MAIKSNFPGNFTARGANAAGPGRFGTFELSGVSDFATHADGERRASGSTKGREFDRGE